MRNGGYIGVRADKALRLLGEKGPMHMSALLCALEIRTQIAASFKITVSKLVDAGILSVTDDQDTLVSLSDPKYKDLANAFDEYEAYKAEKKALPPVKRSMIEDIAFGMAEQGVKASITPA